MNRHQLKAKAARAIFSRMREENCSGEPVFGVYQDAGRAPVTGLELIVLRDVERVGPDGVLVVDQVQVSALACQLDKVRRDGVFTFGAERWKVSVPVRNDGVIVTAAVVAA